MLFDKKIFTPDNCQHLKVFKKDALAAWERLGGNSQLQADKVPGYFRGAYTVAHGLGKQNEASELLMLSRSAKKVLEKRKKT